MSTVPPGPYPQPSPVVGASPTAPPKKVGTAGYWIALALFLVGCGVAVVWFVVAIVGVVNAPNDFARTRVPGSMGVEIGTGEWVLYEEAPGINTSFGNFGLTPDVEVTDPSGSPVTLDYSNFHTTYSNGSHEGRTLASFKARTAGVYEITATDTGAMADHVAIGRPLWEGALGGIIGSIALGSVCFLVALVLLIVTIVRRGKSKRAIAAAPYQPVPHAPGAPGSFAAPIPTGPAAPRPPGAPGAPPAPGTYGGPMVPPPPGAAPAAAPYTPGWAAPEESQAPVPPPPAPTGFTAPGVEPSAPSGDLGSWPPPPAEPVGADPGQAEPPAPEPPAPEAPAPETEPSAGNDDWDKPGTF